MGNYVSQAQVEDRLSVAVVRRVFDDNNDGLADNGPLARVITDGEAWFESVALCVYPDQTALRRDGGVVAQTMVLDCIEALFARRFPHAVKREWTQLWEYTDKQLMRLRRGEIQLPIQGSPNPAANTGGAVYAGDEVVSALDEPTFFAVNGTGLF